MIRAPAGLRSIVLAGIRLRVAVSRMTGCRLGPGSIEGGTVVPRSIVLAGVCLRCAVVAIVLAIAVLAIARLPGARRIRDGLPSLSRPVSRCVPRYIPISVHPGTVVVLRSVLIALALVLTVSPLV